MYDILLSDMSEKEQMEALNTPYRKKKPKARERKIIDRCHKERFGGSEPLDEKEKEEEEEEEEGQEEGQEEEEPTVVTYDSATRIRYSRSRITTKTTKRRSFPVPTIERLLFGISRRLSTKKIFRMFCRRQCSSFNGEQKFAQW